MLALSTVTSTVITFEAVEENAVYLISSFD